MLLSATDSCQAGKSGKLRVSNLYTSFEENSKTSPKPFVGCNALNQSPFDISRFVAVNPGESNFGFVLCSVIKLAELAL